MEPQSQSLQIVSSSRRGDNLDQRLFRSRSRAAPNPRGLRRSAADHSSPDAAIEMARILDEPPVRLSVRLDTSPSSSIRQACLNKSGPISPCSKSEKNAVDAARDRSKSSGPGALNRGAATCLQPGATGSWRAGDREGSFLLAGSRALIAAALRFYNHMAAAIRGQAHVGRPSHGPALCGPPGPPPSQGHYDRPFWGNGACNCGVLAHLV